MTKRLLAVAALGLMAAATQAMTYTNSAIGTVQPLGSPDTTSYGETFNLSSDEVLNTWSFFAAEGNAGNVHLVVANWDTYNNKPVGPELFRSSSFAYEGGSVEFRFSNIALQLGAGSYIAFLSTAGEATPLSSVAMRAATDNGGLGGAFTFLNSFDVDPLVAGSSWEQPGSWLDVQSLNYAATFSTAVPEPATHGTMTLGLFAIGMSVRLNRMRGKTKVA